MPDRATMLRDQTYKEEGMEVGRRVYYTLSDNKAVQAHRNTKALALVINLLREKNIMSEKELDDLLFECLG